MSTKIVAGLDEAGLGPRLGPLVVSAAAFRVHGGKEPFALEDRLPGLVGRAPTLGHGVEPLPLDDSKRLYRSGRGLSLLERTALSFFYALHGKVPENLGSWVRKVTVHGDVVLQECPWYGPDPRALPLPLFHVPEEIARVGERVALLLEQHGAEVSHLVADVVTAPELNRRIERSGNKASALASSYETLMSRVAGDGSANRVELDADKLGGRAYYAGLLQRVFPGRFPSVEEEGRVRSTYRIARPGGEVRVRFLRKGDATLAHVALASILSKYTRELFMTLFNRFWGARMPGLRPTAGYPLDARRFLSEISPAARKLGLDPARFTRAR